MNYLAHVFLSDHTPEGVVGALLGDFVKGAVGAPYSAPVREAILLHRAIDRYTDAHAGVRASCALVSRERRRFAGIMVDVFYDHFLARHWSSYCAVPLADFTREVYAILSQHSAGFPERLQRLLPYMIEDDWLGSYRELGAIDAALNGIARRFKRFPRAQQLREAVQELEQNYSRFEDHFLAFFPELRRYVQAGAPGTAGPGDPVPGPVGVFATPVEVLA
jgi:acyl carrier protein phosphodiesterase